MTRLIPYLARAAVAAGPAALHAVPAARGGERVGGEFGGGGSAVPAAVAACSSLSQPADWPLAVFLKERWTADGMAA